MQIGLVGLGRMGLPMAGHIAAAHHDLVVYDISQEARDRAADSGLAVVSGLEDLSHAEVVVTSLPATEHVETVFLGDGSSASGLVSILAEGAICVDMSTISVAGSRDVAQRCAEAGITFLDAPVSGTSIHAEAGTLVAMVGGEEAGFETVRPIVECFATEVAHVGVNGAGLQLKLITNRLLTTHMVAIAEAIISIEQTELSVQQCLDLLRSGAVPRLLDYKAQPLAERDFSPMFTVDLMRKDLRLASEEFAPGALGAAAHEVVEATSDSGLGSEDLAALITTVEQRST